MQLSKANLTVCSDARGEIFDKNTKTEFKLAGISCPLTYVTRDLSSSGVLNEGGAFQWAIL